MSWLEADIPDTDYPEAPETPADCAVLHGHRFLRAVRSLIQNDDTKFHRFVKRFYLQPISKKDYHVRLVKCGIEHSQEYEDFVADLRYSDASELWEVDFGDHVMTEMPGSLENMIAFVIRSEYEELTYLKGLTVQEPYPVVEAKICR